MKIKRKLVLVSLISLFILLFFIPIAYADTCGLKEEMTVKYIFKISVWEPEIPHESTLTYSKVSEDSYSMNWLIAGAETSFWTVSSETRLCSEAWYRAPVDASYDNFWIFTDVSIGENVTMFHYFNHYVTYEKHTNFTITGETTHGDMDVWVLEDEFGGVAHYEKTVGFLVNASLVYESGKTAWNTLEFVETDAFKKIPGYNMPILVILLAITSLVIIHKLKKQK